MCVESLVTAVVDMYPKTFRVGYRRELLILGMSVASFILGLSMLTEVSFIKCAVASILSAAVSRSTSTLRLFLYVSSRNVVTLSIQVFHGQRFTCHAEAIVQTNLIMKQI